MLLHQRGGVIFSASKCREPTSWFSASCFRADSRAVLAASRSWLSCAPCAWPSCVRPFPASLYSPLILSSCCRWVVCKKIVPLRPFQLSILLNQLFQTEALKLYRNLGVATLALATVDNSFAIFRMANVLARFEGCPRYRLWFCHLGNTELFPARREKLGDVADGIVGGAGVAAFLLAAVAGGFGGIRALVFI